MALFLRNGRRIAGQPTSRGAAPVAGDKPLASATTGAPPGVTNNN
ncbi:MAG: hypothetical protein QOD76_2163 [Solirubrobacteraceae bacterium]|jgi:hypothetical protein|nr:hypothetical protein [Solirubrobacteraceae bacterium]